jgi:hypothetical protein
MLDSSAAQILATVADDALVIDVGGGTSPFERADWVMDALGYDERSDLGVSHGTGLRTDEERFGADTWVQRDFCDREPWPFPDDHFDFAICSQTLEDVRDPVWMCSELNRIAKRGYIEVPSRLEEQTFGFQGPWAGWTHHRWLIDVDQAAATIEFVHKPHLLNTRVEAQFPAQFRNRLTDAERVQTLWWNGSFSYRERLFWNHAEFDAYVAGFVEAELAARGLTRRELSAGWRARLTRLRRRATGGRTARGRS